MFDPTSRYFGLPVGSITIPGSDGRPREVRYVRRRFIPPDEGLPTLLEHAVTEGDRLDNIAARYLGDPTQFWRICDANDVLRPQELTEAIGRTIRIALPRP
jgi:hypothetical protein